MPSVVDVCNLALARLGESATVSDISPPDGSVQAEHCAAFYPIARDSVLQMHAWGFASKRARLGLLDVESFGWSFAYAAPSDALAILSILPPASRSGDRTQPFARISDADGGPIILTDCHDATVHYISRAEDPNKYSPLFVDALSWRLASDLAGPLLKGDAGAAQAKSMYQSFLFVLGTAKVSDASQQRIEQAHTPAWIGGR
jgi:hypothetical protein